MLWKFTPDQREYTVLCDTFVATALLMFEDVDEIPYNSIQQRMNLRLDILDVVVKTLLRGEVSEECIGAKAENQKASINITPEA